MLGIFGRRRRILIDRRQLSLLSINLAYVCAITLIFCLILFAPAVLVLYDSGSTFEERDQAAGHLLLLHKTVWPAFLIVLVLFFLHSLLYSHRMIGPLFRLRAIFETIGQGDLSSRVRLRSRDHLHPEADRMNAMLDELARRLARLRSQEAAARAAARHARALAAREGASRTEEILDGLVRRMDELNGGLAEFVLPDGIDPEPHPVELELEEVEWSDGSSVRGDRDVVLVHDEDTLTRS